MKYLSISFIAFFSFSCGGGAGDPNGTTVPLSDLETGAVIVQNTTSKNYIDESGKLADISSNETVIVKNGGRGYAFGFGRVSSFDYGSQLVGDEEDIYSGIAAVIPSSDVGSAVSTPYVAFDGTYQLQFQNVNANGKLGEIDDANGTIQIEVNFDAGTGSISDDFMEGSTQASKGSELAIGDGTVNGQDFSLEVAYEGSSGYIEGIFGDEGLVGAMAGTGDNGFFVGGVIADAE